MDATLKFTETSLFLIKIDSFYRIQVYFSNLKINILLCLDIITYLFFEIQSFYIAVLLIFLPRTGSKM